MRTPRPVAIASGVVAVSLVATGLYVHQTQQDQRADEPIATTIVAPPSTDDIDEIVPVSAINVARPQNSVEHVPAMESSSVVIADAGDSALVRLAVSAAPADVSLSIAGSAALVVPAGHSASTSLLVPLIDGRADIVASAPVDVDVEPLLVFTDKDSPGATSVLTESIRRADTTVGLAGDELGTDPVTIGVTGHGVPVTGVRAVHVTAVVDTDSDTDLLLAGQRLPVHAGVTAVSTIVIPSDDGTITAALEHGSGDVTVDVRGWVREASQNVEAVNTSGSYVPTRDVHAAEAVVGADEVAVVDVERVGADYALALVAATGSPEGSQLSVGDASLGLTVDPVLGAAPQLVVVSGSELAAQSANGSVEITAAPIGHVLNTSVSDPAAEPGDIAIEITSPPVVDLTTVGTFELTGTITAGGPAVERVDVAVDGRTVGTATVSGDGTRWSYTTSAPASGDYLVTATVTDRIGRTAEASQQVAVTIPSTAAQTVLSPDLVVLDSTVPVAQLDADSVLFAADPGLAPGQIVATGPTDSAPDGFLRTVDSVDRTAAGWLVSTSDADETDAVLQTDTAIALDVAGATTSERVSGTDRPVTVIDEGVAEVVDRTPIVDLAGGKTRSYEVSGAYAWPLGQGLTDLSRATAETRAAALAAIHADGGAYLTGSATVDLSYEFVLKIGVTWKWGFLPVPAVTDHRVTASYDATSTVAVDATLTAPLSDGFSLPLVDFDLPTTLVWVGPVPLVVALDVNVGIAAGIDAAVSGRAEVTVSSHGTYGYGYTTEGGFRVIKEENNEVLVAPTITAAASASAVANLDVWFGPRLDTGVTFYDTAGGRFAADLTVGVAAELAAHAATDGTVGASYDLRPWAAVDLRGSVHLQIPLVRIRVAQWAFPILDQRWELGSFTGNV